MKITIFTLNHRRHNHYINELVSRGHEVMAIIEATTLFSGLIKDHFNSSKFFLIILNMSKILKRRYSLMTII